MRLSWGALVAEAVADDRKKPPQAVGLWRIRVMDAMLQAHPMSEHIPVPMIGQIDR